MAKSADVPSPQRAISYRSFSLFDRPNPTPNARLSVTMVPTAHTNPINQRKGKAVMESQQSTQTPSNQMAELGQRMARMETKMDYVATHKDIAEVRTEVTSLKGELLTEIAGIQTLVANREASMQRWLLGITATTVVGVSSAMLGVAAALIQAFG